MQAAALFDPGYGLLFVDPRPGQPAVHDAVQPISDHLLGPVEACQEDAGGVTDLVGDHGALGSFELEGCQDQLLRRFEQFFGERNLEGYVKSPARGLGVANGRPHISRIERSRRSMHAARGVSDEMLDGQVRLGGTFRHIWASGNIAISPHSNYKDLSEYRHNRSSLHPCSVRDGPRSLPHLPAGRAQPKGQSQRRSMRHFLRHYVATSTTSIFVVENISSTIMVYSIPGALVNGRTACHQCIKQQAGGTGWNSDPT